MDLKKILITLSVVAAVLIAITFYVVFYGGGGTYVVSSMLGPNSIIFSSSTAGNAASGTQSGTQSSTLAIASSSDETAGSSTISEPNSGAGAISWTQGNETLSIVGTSISGNQLTLDVQVAMGPASECVPLTLRMIADEQGNLSPPITSQFTFPDSGTCNGTAGELYSAQPVVFTIANPSVFPILLTTGGTANTLFEVVQNADGSLTAQLPPNTG